MLASIAASPAMKVARGARYRAACQATFLPRIGQGFGFSCSRVYPEGAAGVSWSAALQGWRISDASRTGRHPIPHHREKSGSQYTSIR